jgi:hypothetical protein
VVAVSFLQASATALGLRLERVPSLNDTPALVRALASLVQYHLPLIERTL